MVTVEPDLEPPRVPKYTPRPTATAAPPITATLNQRCDHKLRFWSSWLALNNALDVCHGDRGLSDLVAVSGIHVDLKRSNLAVGHPVHGAA